MPLYEYRCKHCQHHFEKIQKFSDDPVRVCPHCGQQAVEQLLSPPAIQFKGSGWYVTDYAHKGGSSPAPVSTPASTPSPTPSSSESSPASTGSK